MKAAGAFSLAQPMDADVSAFLGQNGPLKLLCVIELGGGGLNRMLVRATYTLYH